MTVTALPPAVDVVVETVSLATTMTPAEARRLTDRIRGRFTELKQLVLDAYEGQIQIALGYVTWEAYVDAELSISRVHSYRLMEAARAERALEQVLAEHHPRVTVANGDKITVPESLVRGINLDRAIETVRGRLNGERSAAEALAVFRSVADEMRRQPPEPDESVLDDETRHVTDIQITQITDPVNGGAAWLWESVTGWNRGWVRIVRTGDPRDILAAWSEIQSRYRQHLRGEVLQGSDLSVARPRASTHDPVDWQGPIDRNGIKGWLAPSGHFYPEESSAARKMLAKRLALGLPT